MTTNKLRIEALEKEVATLKTEDSVLTYGQNLATALHTKFCRHNHTDGCAWYYEENKQGADWSRSTHKDYLDKAMHLVNVCVEYRIKNSAIEAILKVL